MKKLILTFIALICFAQLKISAQNFEGTISFKTTFTELPAEMESMRGMMEMTMVTHAKDHLSRTETKGMMTPEIVNIMDMKKKEMVTCMDQGGQKIAIKTNIDDMTQQNEQNGVSAPVYKETGETRKILGFECKKVIVTVTSEEVGEMKIDLWYTPEIANNSYEYTELKGMPLEYTIPIQPGMVMQMTATEITKGKVDDSMFVIPEGYTITTMEELQKSGPSKK
jgi:GLPGLI family protein